MTVTVIDIENDLTEFTSTETDGGKVTANPIAAMVGYRGMLINVDNNNTKRCNKAVTKSVAFSSLFYFDPNGITMSTGDECNLLAMQQEGGSYGYFALVLLYKAAGGYQLAFQGINDAGSLVIADYESITDVKHTVRFECVRATNSTSSDGSYEWWIDEVSKGSVSGVDNYNRMQDYDWTIRFGVSGVDTGTRGYLLMDYLTYQDSAGVFYAPKRILRFNNTTVVGIAYTGKLSGVTFDDIHKTSGICPGWDW